MLSRWIQKTRQKSDDEKRIIALSLSFFLTAIIFGVWLFFVVNAKVAREDNIAAQSTASPIQSVKNLFKNLVE